MTLPRVDRLLQTLAAMSLLMLVDGDDSRVRQASAAGTGTGSLTVLEGLAKAQRGGTGSWTACHKGMTVGAGDRIATEAESRLEITFADGSKLRLDEDSQIDLEAVGTVARIKLWFGKLGASVRKLATPGSQFEVHTPTAVAAVRGTEFRVEVDGSDEADPDEAGTEIAVYEGEVEVVDLAGEIEAIEDDPTTYGARRAQYALRLKANERANVSRRRMLQRQFTGEVVKVGVLPFKAHVRTVSNAVGMQAAERLAKFLAAVTQGRYEVVPPQAMQRHAVALSASSREVKHVGALQEIAKKSGATVLVVGTVAELRAAGGRLGGRTTPDNRRAFPSRRPRGGPAAGKAAGRFAGTAEREASGALVLSLRAIHAPSGQVLFAKTLRLPTDEERAAFAAKMKTIGDRLSGAVPSVGVVQSAAADQVTLALRNADQIRPGARFLILKRNQFVVHPQTGKRLAPRVAGVVEVTRVETQRVQCRVVTRKGNQQIAKRDIAAPVLSQQRKPLLAKPLDAQKEAARAWLRGGNAGPGGRR